MEIIKKHTVIKYDKWDEKKSLDKSTIVHLQMKCVSCHEGKYSLDRGSYVWENGTGDLSPITCRRCPSGGVCGNGQVRSLPAFWGFKRNQSIFFVPCPQHFCNSTGMSYDSCSNNRIGTLCGECKVNYSLNIFNSECISTEFCDEHFVQTFISILITA